MNPKQIVGIIGIGLCFLLLGTAAAGIITWRLFWVALLFVGGIAYFVLPEMHD